MVQLCELASSKVVYLHSIKLKPSMNIVHTMVHNVDVFLSVSDFSFRQFSKFEGFFVYYISSALTYIFIDHETHKGSPLS